MTLKPLAMVNVGPREKEFSYVLSVEGSGISISSAIVLGFPLMLLKSPRTLAAPPAPAPRLIHPGLPSPSK